VKSDTNTGGGQHQGEESPEEKIRRLQSAIVMLEGRVRMLEAENARLADMLKKQGCKVRAVSATAVELPPPVTEPLAADSGLWAGLEQSERTLLDEIRQGRELFFLAKSKTGVDVGHWFTRGKLVVAAAAEELLLFARGRKPYMEQIPFRFLKESLYNHVTGEVVFSPALEARTQSLRIAPVEGYKLLAQIYGGQDNA